MGLALERLRRAKAMVAWIRMHDVLSLPRDQLVERIERQAPADIDGDSAAWRMRLWGFQATSTAGPQGAVSNWCQQIDRKAKEAGL